VSEDEDSYGGVTARFYDAAYATLPGLGADVDFYRGLAHETGGPVLELGCGTGRVLLEIAQGGQACTGVDVSNEMLATLRSRARAQGVAAPRLVCTPMQAFDLAPERFGLVFSAFRAFQHLYTVQDQLDCLARVRRHLAPGGVFAFDVFSPRLELMAQDEEPEAEDLRFFQDGEEVVRHTRVWRDRPQQLLRLAMRYERWRDGRVVGNEHVRFRMRWFHRYELEHLLFRAGFDDVVLYGDFDRAPIGAGTPAYVVVARNASTARLNSPGSSK
jgi:SAM-dependent methyltransferase